MGARNLPSLAESATLSWKLPCARDLTELRRNAMRSDPTLDLPYSVDPAAAMKAYIRQHFSDLLGPHVALLDEPNGLDTLAHLVRSGSLAAADHS